MKLIIFCCFIWSKKRVEIYFYKIISIGVNSWQINKCFFPASSRRRIQNFWGPIPTSLVLIIVRSKVVSLYRWLSAFNPQSVAQKECSTPSTADSFILKTLTINHLVYFIQLFSKMWLEEHKLINLENKTNVSNDYTYAINL